MTPYEAFTEVTVLCDRYGVPEPHVIVNPDPQDFPYPELYAQWLASEGMYVYIHDQEQYAIYLRSAYLTRQTILHEMGHHIAAYKMREQYDELSWNKREGMANYFAGKYTTSLAGVEFALFPITIGLLLLGGI